MDERLTAQLDALSALLAHAATIAAPFDAQLKALEIAKADALTAVQWEIDTLKTIVRAAILAHGHTVRHERLTVGYVHKDVWDSERLHAFAKEVPALLQCLKDGSYVTFRYRAS